MDILYLVDRLEESIKKGVRIPFTTIRLVDERSIRTLIDQMRISIPDEVRRAQRIGRERDKIMAEARERAEQLVREAEARAGELSGEHAIAQAAEARAAAIRQKAEREAATLRRDAQEYAFNALCQLEEELQRTLRVVENGLRRIQVEQAEETTPESPAGT